MHDRDRRDSNVFTHDHGTCPLINDNARGTIRLYLQLFELRDEFRGVRREFFGD